MFRRARPFGRAAGVDIGFPWAETFLWRRICYMDEQAHKGPVRVLKRWSEPPRFSALSAREGSRREHLRHNNCQAAARAFTHSRATPPHRQNPLSVALRDQTLSPKRETIKIKLVSVKRRSDCLRTGSVRGSRPGRVGRWCWRLSRFGWLFSLPHPVSSAVPPAFSGEP